MVLVMHKGNYDFGLVCLRHKGHVHQVSRIAGTENPTDLDQQVTQAEA